MSIYEILVVIYSYKNKSRQYINLSCSFKLNVHTYRFSLIMQYFSGLKM